MDVYFIRHGQTDGNVARRHQHHETELNEIGQAQIRQITPVILALKPTRLITSTQLRAVETAKIIIAGGLDLIPDTHQAFEELQRPANMVGQRYFGPKTLWYIWRWFIGKDKRGGEDYEMFLDRIKAARTYLESLAPDDRVVVVSHAIFINVFLQHLCQDERMSLWRAFISVWRIFFMTNANIVHLKYDGKGKGNCAWRVVSNDYK